MCSLHIETLKTPTNLGNTCNFVKDLSTALDTNAFILTEGYLGGV